MRVVERSQESLICSSICFAINRRIGHRWSELRPMHQPHIAFFLLSLADIVVPAGQR